MVTRNYPHGLQLNKANSADTEAVLDLHLLISNGFVSSKIYDKRDDFDFDIFNFPFEWRGSSFLPMVFTYFARISSHLANFNARNKAMTAKLLQQGYRYHKLRKSFVSFIINTTN